ncbi:MAG TPA: nicotinate-nucleotide adenylyltransferase [Nitrospira sp.]|jgi:nicotinate-nucleotide adenylyltransferase|nr:nicotinate-nucleotide adenylyltransferase [Nitrospira sp.]
MSFPKSKHSPLPTSRSLLKLGLLGGSFNPVHNGHLTIASHVHERLQLSQIIFIPTGDPPHKRGGSLAPADVRSEMVRLAIAECPFFTVSDIEIRRKGTSYSIDTLRALQRHYGPSTELFFIIGLDAFLDFPTWREPNELLKLCHFVVLSRPERSFQALAAMPLLPNLNPLDLAQLDIGNKSRLDISVSSCPGITCLALPPCPVSASEIRWRVRNGLPLANMLPPPVQSYILRHSLYQEDTNRTCI